MPGVLVDIQLFKIPGEERKFTVWVIMAFIPTCSCERETASQTFVSDGISTMGVGNVSGTGDSVGEGSAVAVAVAVGISVGEGMEVGVFVGTRVAVGEVGVDEAGTTVAVEGGGVIVGIAT